MKYKVRIIKSAQNDMLEVYRYIANDLQNPTAATNRITLIDEKIQSLKENPSRLPPVRDSYLASKGFRLILVKSHLIFYIIREEIKTVSIMRVLYARRDWARILKASDVINQVDEA